MECCAKHDEWWMTHMVMFPLPGGLHRSLKFNFWWFLESETTKAGFFPPLTLVLCDSGKDNQLRAKSPAMIVIMSQKTNQTTTNSRVTSRHTLGLSKPHIWMNLSHYDPRDAFCTRFVKCAEAQVMYSHVLCVFESFSIMR